MFVCFVNQVSIVAGSSSQQSASVRRRILDNEEDGEDGYHVNGVDAARPGSSGLSSTASTNGNSKRLKSLFIVC